MITPTIVSLDGTGNPIGDGCTANYEIAFTDSGTTEWGDQYDYSYIRLNAHEAEGWAFDHFEFTKREADKYGTYDYPITIQKSSCERDGSDFYFPIRGRTDPMYFDLLYEGTSIFAPGQSYENTYRYEIIRCVAVFAKTVVRSSITVNAIIEPEGAVDAGCDVHPATQIKTGNPGSSAPFTLTATEFGKWKFKYWKDSSGSFASSNNPYSLAKTFSSSNQVFDYAAVFIESTGELLYGASGDLIFGSSGNPLFKG